MPSGTTAAGDLDHLAGVGRAEAAGIAWALNAMNANRVAIEANKASSLRIAVSRLVEGQKIEHTAFAISMALRPLSVFVAERAVVLLIPLMAFLEATWPLINSCIFRKPCKRLF